MPTISLDWKIVPPDSIPEYREPCFLVPAGSQEAESRVKGTPGIPETISRAPESLEGLSGGTLFLSNWEYCPEFILSAVKNGFSLYNVEHVENKDISVTACFRMWKAHTEYTEH